jgi:hypothetical protein
MRPDPRPPLLLVRERSSFGVEHAPVAAWSATPSAFADGCYRGCFCLDETGTAWRIEHARLAHAPTRLNRWLPWRRIPIEIALSAPAPMSVDQVVSHLVDVLRSENEFCEWLSSRVALADLERRFRVCTTPAEVIRLADAFSA